jgi:anti-sigma regulatory factor (Ser/Thr protein kinase)
MRDGVGVVQLTKGIHVRCVPRLEGDPHDTPSLRHRPASFSFDRPPSKRGPFRIQSPRLCSSPAGSRAGPLGYTRTCEFLASGTLILSNQRNFRHEAFFYSGEDGFLAGVLPFIRDAVAAGEPTLVAVDEPKIRAIQAALNGGHEQLVQFEEMRRMGRNPACIIPAWREFVAEQGGRGHPIRGIGEPIWPGRSDAELVECHQHESLLNLVFAETQDFWLLCPYDAGALEPDVVAAAHCTHPLIAGSDEQRASHAYVPPGTGPGPFDTELPEPGTEPEELEFGRDELPEVRRFTFDRAQEAGLAPDRAADLVLAVSELATNSVLHADGGGTLRVWREGSDLLCEVLDAGRLDEPLVGRARPNGDRSNGRGLWLVNHLCDLVQLRSFPTGNVARLHMSFE